MKLRVAFCAFTILLAPVVLAKTKFMVEDPNNVVVGRYGITSSQAAAAAEIAETFLTGGQETFCGADRLSASQARQRSTGSCLPNGPIGRR